MKLVIYLLLMPKLKISGAVPLFHLCLHGMYTTLLLKVGPVTTVNGIRLRNTYVHKRIKININIDIERPGFNAGG